MSDQRKPIVNAANTGDDPDTSVIDINEIDESVPLTVVEAPKKRHHGKRMSKTHIQRIRRRHHRERFLFRLNMILLAVICLGGAGTLITLQALR